MATVVERQMTTQHFRTEKRSQSQHVELMTPEGDLGDVEADFQRMVNEMVSDGSRKAVAQTSKMSYSTSSQMSQKSAPKTLTIKIPNRPYDAGVVKALPAKVTPESGDVIVEKVVGVKDRIRKIENQRSFEEAVPPHPHALPRAVTKSSSVKNLSEQYEKSCETVNKFNEMTTSQNIDREIANVKNIASTYQPASAPARPPAPFLSDTEEEKSHSRRVVKSSSHPAPFSSYSEQSSKYSSYQTQSSATSSAHNELDSALADIDKYASELDRTVDSSSTALPLQYSAKVKCEVTSRVNEPQTDHVNSETTSQIRQSRFDSWSSSAHRTDMSSAECNSPISKFTPAAPTPLARTVAKPPRADSENAQSKFSLLRSASAGSAGAFEEGMRYSSRSNSDKDLPKFSVKKVHSGSSVWTPGAQSEHSVSRLESPDLPSFKDVPTVWIPARGGSASPSAAKKEYRKISFDGPTVPKRNFQETNPGPRPEESFAWKDREAEITLPRVQSPTVTLLQKKREGQINDHKPDYLKGDDTGFFKPGDKLYTIKKEYESEDEEHGSRKFAILGHKKIEGVGPTTRDGIPVSLKTGVKSEHQGEWYKRMFDSLHKVKDDSSNKYQSSKVRYGGYMSEPDGYDSDAGITRYGRFDRSKNEFEVEQTDNTLSRKTKRYVHQPGRIENYVPGFSSLSERELRENPEADVKLEISAPSGRPSKETFQGGKKSAYNVFKDGYESDSTLVFKKREENRLNIPDPRKSREIYRQIQKGGDIPLSGLQRPAPRNKVPSSNKYETSEVNIHYRTPIRVERKEAVSDEELARRQEEHMQKVYELERRKKYLQELEDIERRRHTDNFTPLQKSPIPLNRYDDESYGYSGRNFKTPDPPRQLAKALFGFQAQNKRELSFNKGDTILIRRQIDKNWLEGEFRGTIGIFPANYVEVQPLKNLESLGKRPTEGQAKVKFNFQAQTTMEMSLNKGEFVLLTRRVDGNWYEGRIGQRKGIFPVSYVEVLSQPINGTTSPSTETMSRPALPPAHLLYNGTSSANSPYSTLGYHGNHSDTKAPYSQLTVSTQQEPIAYRALYNYKPQNDDELELLEGDVVMVMEKCDDGWFVGTSQRTNLFGTFPGNYVEKI